jgi:hypothetical protein
MDLCQWNYERYLRDQAWLQKTLEGVPGTLADRISLLHEQQLHVGFIRDPLSDVKRCRLVDPGDRRVSFLTQYNPRRSDRASGAGRKDPPNSFKSVNNGCFLCKENIFWQQCGLEMGYRFTVNDRPYIVWCNPFPLMRTHVTIASEVHEPQTWVIEDSHEGSRQRAERIIQDLLAIAAQSPEFIVFYNGIGAGASIPAHLHYHAFQRSPGQEPFPLEKVAIRQLKDYEAPFEVDPYPITSVFYQGDANQITEGASGFLDAWTRICGSSANLSANIIATQTPRRPNSGPLSVEKPTFDLYFIPRNREYLISSGRIENVGGLETLGEIAFSNEKEFKRLTSGEIDFAYVRRMLMSVEAPEAVTLIEQCRKTLKFIKQ